MDKEDQKPLILEVLRQEPGTQFSAVAHRVRGLAPGYRHDDSLKVYEIIWELLVQGVLAPGFNSANLDFFLPSHPSQLMICVF